MSMHAYASRDLPPSHTLLDQNLDPRVLGVEITGWFRCFLRSVGYRACHHNQLFYNKLSINELAMAQVVFKIRYLDDKVPKSG